MKMMPAFFIFVICQIKLKPSLPKAPSRLLTSTTVARSTSTLVNTMLLLCRVRNSSQTLSLRGKKPRM